MKIGYLLLLQESAGQPWSYDLVCRSFLDERYGDVVTNEMQEVHSKVVQMALPKPN
jgi:hypothetical protein